jgi:NTP pyrophosphatase (non-canonical NTP hydrolase)
MLMEECAELIRATNKLNRDEDVKTSAGIMFIHAENFIEEIADVEIMLEQMIQYYNLRSMIDKKKQEKLKRLEILLTK